MISVMTNSLHRMNQCDLILLFSQKILRLWKVKCSMMCGATRDIGITTIIVEQNAVAALRLSDRAIILDGGKVVFSGTSGDVLDNKELRHEYLAI